MQDFYDLFYHEKGSRIFLLPFSLNYYPIGPTGPKVSPFPEAYPPAPGQCYGVLLTCRIVFPANLAIKPGAYRQISPLFSIFFLLFHIRVDTYNEGQLSSIVSLYHFFLEKSTNNPNLSGEIYLKFD